MSPGDVVQTHRDVWAVCVDHSVRPDISVIFPVGELFLVISSLENWSCVMDASGDMWVLESKSLRHVWETT